MVAMAHSGLEWAPGLALSPRDGPVYGMGVLGGHQKLRLSTAHLPTVHLQGVRKQAPMVLCACLLHLHGDVRLLVLIRDAAQLGND